jgi:hypothetical protein
VTVYNAGTTKGAAGTAAELLKTKGYANADKTFSAAPVTPNATTVYYSSAAQAATAQDVATALGVSTTEENAQVADGAIVVVVK